MHRPTRDIDLLGSGPADCDIIERIVAEFLSTPVKKDGLRFDIATIKAAVIATFERKRTALPSTTPPSLQSEFAELKQTQWKAFLRRNKLEDIDQNFSTILAEIREHLPINWESL